MTPGLDAAVARYLAQHQASGLRAASAALSGRYRSGGTSIGVDFAAYLTVRLPATFAAVSCVLAEVRELRPDLQPVSLVDAGSGPGTAVWAAADTWPGLAEATFLDSNADFLAVAAALAREAEHPALQGARCLHAGISGAVPDADMVVAAYALAEIPIADRAPAIQALWRAARKLLIPARRA